MVFGIEYAINFRKERSKTMKKISFFSKRAVATIAILCCVQISEAYIQFMSKEELVSASEYIVTAKMQHIDKEEKTTKWRGVEATILKNRLKVIESIKGSWSLKKPLILNTYEFDGWMEDNVWLPSVGSKVLLFLNRSESGELYPVNSIHGVWKIDSDGKSNYGTLKEVKEIVEKQVGKIEKSCSSKVFISLLDTAEEQTQAGHYKKALETYQKAYSICPIRDLEEQMAWLMGKIENED